MTKPFPIPPFITDRQRERLKSSYTSQPPVPVTIPDPFSLVPQEDFDPGVTDDETMFILKSYLRPDQYANPKLIKFIMCYLECRNASQACVESGIGKNGSYWRSRPEVHAAIEAITAKAVMKYGYDASEVIQQVKEIAGFDPLVFQNPDGSFKNNLNLIAAEARRAIKKLKVKNIYGQDLNGMPTVTGQIIEIEVWDKQKAHEQLGTEKNIFKRTTVVEHDVTRNMASVLLESGKRAEERKSLMGRVVNEINQEERGGDESGWDGGRVPVTDGSASRGDEADASVEALFREDQVGEGDEGSV